MFNIETDLRIEKELNSAKKTSMLIGVLSEGNKEITGFINEVNEGVELGNYTFEIGSTTKTFTSLLLAKLLHNNTVSLDDPITAYKPEYKNALSNQGEEVTFRHLSTHVSGLPRDDMKKIRKRMKENKGEKDNPYKYYSHEDMHQFLLDYDLKKEIGSKWSYSNLGTGLLGNVLAEIMGTTYEEAIKTEILEPLGMYDSFIQGNPDQYQRYLQSFNTKKKKIPPFEIPAVNGAGAIKSTLNDMLIYLEHQMGLVESPLKKEIELSHEVHAKTGMKQMNMGLGWFIEKKKWGNNPIIHHGGTTTGYHTYCGFIKEEKIGVVICSTVQLTIPRVVKMLVTRSGTINENIAEQIFLSQINGLNN